MTGFTYLWCVPYLSIVPHDVIEPGQKACAGRNLRVHGSIDIVEQVECLRDQLVALT